VIGGDTLYNPYVFPGNNPVGNVDPFGENDIRIKEGTTDIVQWMPEYADKGHLAMASITPITAAIWGTLFYGWDLKGSALDLGVKKNGLVWFYPHIRSRFGIKQEAMKYSDLHKLGREAPSIEAAMKKAKAHMSSRPVSTAGAKELAKFEAGLLAGGDAQQMVWDMMEVYRKQKGMKEVDVSVGDIRIRKASWCAEKRMLRFDCKVYSSKTQDFTDTFKGSVTMKASRSLRKGVVGKYEVRLEARGQRLGGGRLHIDADPESVRIPRSLERVATAMNVASTAMLAYDAFVGAKELTVGRKRVVADMLDAYAQALDPETHGANVSALDLGRAAAILGRHVPSAGPWMERNAILAYGAVDVTDWTQGQAAHLARMKQFLRDKASALRSRK